MALLPPLIIFSLILFIGSSFRLSGAKDCGGEKIATSITVDKDGRGVFKTIQAAIDSMKSNNDQWVKINIHAGTYREKVSIPLEKPCIILKGAGRKSTIITYDDHQIVEGKEVKTIRYDDHQLDNGVWRSTFSSSPPNVIVFGITFEDCVINITGTRSHLSFITAQDLSSQNDPSGFVFRRGSVVGSGKVDLGRAYGPYSRVIFYGTYFSKVAYPKGWYAWRFIGKESKITYAEVECVGPGNDTSRRVDWRKNLTAS